VKTKERTFEGDASIDGSIETGKKDKGISKGALRGVIDQQT